MGGGFGGRAWLFSSIVVSTLLAYNYGMEAIFVELPPFERYRQRYLTDEAFRRLQLELLHNLLKGEVIQGTGGLRKARFGDMQRRKGKRGGIRVIYYWFTADSEIYLLLAYGKNEKADLSPQEVKVLRELVEENMT